MKKSIIIYILVLLTLNLNALDLSIKNNKNTDKEQIIYKDMLTYLKKSNDADQLMILGSLYASGSKEKDSVGDTIPQNPYLAKKYLLQAANMGKYRALTILGGFILLKENMRILDPNLIDTEKYLLNAFQAGDIEAGSLLSNLYFQKNEPNKAIEILYISADKQDSSSQLALAIIFKEGLFINQEQIIKKDLKSANYYLTLACNNNNKTKKVEDFCFNNKKIEISSTK
jgi:TPR repeat protein